MSRGEPGFDPDNLSNNNNTETNPTPPYLPDNRNTRTLRINTDHIQSLGKPLAQELLPDIFQTALENYDKFSRDQISVSITETAHSFLPPYQNIVSAFEQNNVKYTRSQFQLDLGSMGFIKTSPIPVKNTTPPEHFLAFISALFVHHDSIVIALRRDPKRVDEFIRKYHNSLRSTVVQKINRILKDNLQTYADVISLLTFHIDDPNTFFEFLDRLANERPSNSKLGIYNRRNSYIDALSITGNGTWADLREEGVIPTSNYTFENGIWHTPVVGNLIPDGFFRSIQKLHMNDFHGGCPVNHINMPESEETPIARELKQITALAKQEYQNGGFNRIQIEKH